MSDDINAALAAIAKLDRQAAALGSKLKVLNDARAEQELIITNAMNAQGCESFRGKQMLATLVKRRVVSVKDWPALTAFIAKHKAFDLFQRRISTEAYFARVENGDTPPGAVVDTVRSLRITTNKG